MTRPASAWVAFAAVGALVAALCAVNPLYDASAVRRLTVRNGSVRVGKSDGVVDLRGEWLFYRGQLIESAETALPDGFAPLPGPWDAAGVTESRGFASYGVKVTGLVPGTRYAIRVGQTNSACAVFVNGAFVAASGVPGCSAWEERPGWSPVIARFDSRADGSADIALRVSNFHGATGGTSTPIYLGPAADVQRLDERRRASDAFAFSLLAVSGLLFLLQFAFSPDTRHFFWFSLSLLVAGVRSLCFDSMILADFFPALGWQAQYRIANLTFPLLIVFGTAFLARLYGQAITPRRFWVMTSGFIALAAVIVVLPPRASSLILYPAELAALVIVPAVLIFLLSTGIWRLRGGKVVCFAYLAAMVFFMHDLLVSLWVITGFRLGYFGASAFLFSVALVAMDAYASSFDTVRELTLRLREINRALSKFVPREIVDLLGNDGPADFRMAVMHVNVLSAPDAAGSADPSALFSYLNDCFSLVRPVIRAEGGFIARYTGSGSLALFPRGAESALRCAIKLQSAVSVRNRANPGSGRLTVAVGIDCGNVAPGAIVSGAVRRAGSFERAARQFHAKILISAAVVAELPDPVAWFVRPVDRPDIDGNPEFLFEVYNNDPEVVRDLKGQTQSDLEHMLYAVFAGRMDEGRRFFERARAVFPDDPVLMHFARMLQ